MSSRKALLALVGICAIVSVLSTGCATLAPCPGSLLPIVEIQVNNTPSNHDDYGTTGSNIPARARITNPDKFGGGLNFASGVNIELRNAAGASNVAFSTTANGAGSASIFQTLPDDGGWSNFFVRGTATSNVDKSAIIEMATAGSCDEVVIARKAMMIPPGPPPIAANAAQQFEIEIASSPATIDDYITWTPMHSRIRWSNGTPNTQVNVTLRNMANTNHLLFASNGLAGGSTATASTLPLTLNGDGTWQTFYVAGNFNNGVFTNGAGPSVNDKDAVLEVVNSNNTPLTREGLMVRIRKNANTLTTGERNRYLEALKKINTSPTTDYYINFVRTHSRDTGGFVNVSHRQAHSGSAFLPWHRAFVLHIERILQATDPSVALHYWKFDVPASNMFTSSFIGANTTGNFANVSSSPLSTWSVEGLSGIRRRTPYGDNGNPTVPTENATLGLGVNYVNFKAMEGNSHNPAHSTSGFGTSTSSWIGGSPANATRDPLFFFLHCNVDRVWAKWQWLNARNDAAQISVYDLQGSHATPAGGVPSPAYAENINGGIITNRTLGQYAQDQMWPWDNVLGGTGTAQRPSISLLTPFPIVLGTLLPLNKPTIQIVLDYAGRTSSSPSSGLGFGYDDFNPFQ